MGFANPDEAEISALLMRAKRIAVVGLSPKPDRPSYFVAECLQRHGYEILPVRPAVESVLGVKAFGDLSAVPASIDLVDVFRAPEHVGLIVDACIAVKVPALWLQEGVVNEAEAERARAAGITVVMDRCIAKDCMALNTSRKKA